MIEIGTFGICKLELLKNLKVESDDVVFIAGSIVESLVNPYSIGIGNKLSDIDIFVVKRDMSDIKNNGVYNDTIVYDFIKINGKLLDVEYHSYDDIENVFLQVYELDINSNSRARNLISYPNGLSIKDLISFTHRLNNSICIKNEIQYNMLKESLNLNNYSKYVSLYYINSYENRYEDIIGNLQENKFLTANFIAKQALCYAASASVFYYGESFDRDKWLPLKMENLKRKIPDKVNDLELFFDLYFKNETSTSHQLSKNVRDILKYCDKLINDITVEIFM